MKHRISQVTLVRKFKKDRPTSSALAVQISNATRGRSELVKTVIKINLLVEFELFKAHL